jgi:hypothetical protein
MEKLRGQSQERVNRLHVPFFKRLGRGESAKEMRRKSHDRKMQV